MDRILRIKYDRGTMTINVDKFFPTSGTRIRKLGRIMHMDYDHDLKTELIAMLEDRIEAEKDEYRQLYAGINEKAAKLRDAQRTLEKRSQLVKDLRKRKEKALLEDAMYARKKDQDTEHDLRLEYRAAKARLHKLETQHKALQLNVEIVRNEL